MSLPSNVPRYDSVDLIDFDHLEARFVVSATPPVAAAAWTKLAETERRLDHFDWALHVVREPRRLERFIRDLATAFLMSFEATLQILTTERLHGGLDRWIEGRAEYDVVCRGLRTLRNLEAHVQPVELTASSLTDSSRFVAGIESGRRTFWLFPTLTPTDLDRLMPHGRKLRAEECDAWNATVASHSARDLMTRGLRSLVSIVLDSP
ncbi:MAG: hypothetical protein R3E98_15540 [Gemmatimonadota bacterium]